MIDRCVAQWNNFSWSSQSIFITWSRRLATTRLAIQSACTYSSSSSSSSYLVVVNNIIGLTSCSRQHEISYNTQSGRQIAVCMPYNAACGSISTRGPSQVLLLIIDVVRVHHPSRLSLLLALISLFLLFTTTTTAAAVSQVIIGEFKNLKRILVLQGRGYSGVFRCFLYLPAA